MAYNPIITGGGTEAEAQRVTVANDSTGVLSVDDNGGSLTVDGTVAVTSATLATTAKQDTGNSSLSSIDGKLPAQGQALAAASVPVVLTAAQVSTLTPPAAITGFATAAAQTDKSQFTKITDGTDTALVTAAGEQNVLESNSAAIKTAVETIDNAISGSEMQVDVITMPTVTVNAHAVTNAGTFAVQDSEKVADNAGFTDGTTKLMPAGFIYDEVAGTALTENDAAAGRINANRAQVQTIEDGVTRGRYATVSAANALKVDNSGVTQPVSGTVTANLAAGTNNIGDVDVLTMPTVTVNTHAVTVASGGIASGAIASGALASGAVASGAFAAGSIAVGAITKGATSPVAAEDDASADLDYGIKNLAVRKATPANTSGTDGDYEMLQMSAGRLWTSATIDAALPAGTNAIGKLAANSGVDIGDVDVTSIIPGTGATNLGKAVDSIPGATDTGVAPLLVRDDTLATLTPVDGDYTHGRTNARGALWVALDSTAAQNVTVAAALPAGTANIGDVDIASIAAGDNNIGNVDIVTMPTVTVNTHAVTVASGGIASGAIASGAFASGSIASGAIAAGAIAAGATSIATTEDTASAAADHLVKVAQIRLDTPVSGANLSASGDYTQFIADSFGKTWTTGTYPEDLAHVAGEPIMGNGVRRIDTAASSAGTSADWATMDASAEGALWVTSTPTTTSGCTIFRSLDLDETEEEVKATAGNLYGYFVFNAAATTHYLKFYNATAANTTVGTTTPIMTFPIPAGAAANVGFPYPVSFGTALSAAVTTGVADADTGAPAANACVVNIFYK